MVDHTKHRPGDRRQFIRDLGRLGAGIGLAGSSGLLMAQADGEPTALERIRTKGVLTVGVYHELPPFHVKGEGIDVELGKALAASLGLKASILPFHAGENVNDDLRNMVWRGHYLGWGPADVLLHVPVDRPLMDANPQVQIFGPYWRESVVIARDLSRIPQLDDLGPLRNQKVAVPGMSLAGWLMLGVDGGSLANQLITKIDDGVIAAQMLQRGEVGAACGLRSELQATLKGDPRFAITPLPTPRAPRDGWAVGMAVKRGAKDLAQALQGAVNGLGERGELKRLFAAGALDWQRV